MVRRAAWLTAAGIVGASMGCADLGYRDEVLWRIPSPDGQMLAVCQEVPAFDGPGYAIRLERPDGGLLRPLYGIGDGDPCSEMAWSPDGRILAVLSGHVARVRFVDVAWAVAHASTTTASWSWRQVDFGSEQGPLNGAALRFVSLLHVELQLCPAQRATPALSNGRRTCGPDATIRRFDVPLPIVTGHELGGADASERWVPGPGAPLYARVAGQDPPVAIPGARPVTIGACGHVAYLYRRERTPCSWTI